MKTGLFIALAFAMLAVVAVLLLGLFSLAKGGEFSKKYGNKLMQARVASQLFAVAMLVLAYLLSDK